MSIELEKQGIWTTRDKQQIHVKDMSDSHLINVAKMLIRIAKGMAIEDNDRLEFNAFTYRECLPQIAIYSHADNELQKRNLVIGEWWYTHDNE